ncbi:DUF6541 family protein [Microbacterium sp. HMWF026]|uniref:DUF6541 family protein n=1 Tax=Microbacterium sp. HMWF026 TaxID=2056861 RepID=UPI0011B1D682|nr:DUF6541 family protein [Microbacterium sp. HMWF026]
MDLVRGVGAGLVFVLTPGLLVLSPMRLTLIPRIALAGVAGTASAGIAAIGFGMLGVAWSPWQPVVPALLGAALLALGVRRTVRPVVPSSRWMDAGLVLALLAAGALAAMIVFRLVADPDRPSQTYDNVFHLAAIAAILDGGSASSLTLRTLIETGQATSFYPSAWHVLVASVVQMTGVSVPVAANAAWVVLVAGVWAPGSAWLAQTLVPGSSRRRSAAVAIPLSVAFGSMPYALLTWGSLYPTFFATALLPGAVALPIVCTRVIREARSMRQWRATLLSVISTMGVVGTLAIAQPRVIVSWAVLLAPAAATGLWLTARRTWGDRHRWDRRRRVLTTLGLTAVVLAVFAAGALLAVRLDVFARPVDERLGGPQAAATQSIPEALWSAVMQAWPTGVPEIAPWVSPVLGVVVAGGLIVAARTRGIRWVVAAYVIVVVLYALAAGSDDVLAKLATGIWYKDRYRLASVVPVLGVVLATLALTTGASRAAERLRRPRLAAGAAIGASVAVAVAGQVSLAGPFGSAVAEVLRMPETPERGVVVGAQQVRFMSAISETVPADQRVLGDPWDGSAWTQVFGGREPVFPHVNGQWDDQRTVLAWELAAIGSDPRVCEALDDLRVRYVLYNPHELGGGDPAGNHFPGPHAAVHAGLFELVRTDGESALYRIDVCGPLPEVHQ